MNFVYPYISVDAGEVTDAHIMNLSKQLSPGHFYAISVAVKRGFNEAQAILIKNHLDYSQTYTEILHAWRDQSPRNLGDLDNLLRKAEAGGLIAKYKNLCSTT